MTTELSQSIQTIPLSQLTVCADNVRRTGRDEGIAELAASIAAHGLLQNLTVRPERARKGKAARYGVLAGGRRLAALQLLAERGDLAPDAPIPCQIVTDGIAAEISLAENALQCPMHPADQYEAFAALHRDYGLGAEDIAARFGVTAAVVRQRLKLGAVSPALMAVYRAGDMNLDQLSAFAITNDHAAQEAVWEGLKPWNQGRDAILHALSPGQVHASDPRTRLIGAEAYEAAGGIVTRDLFDAKEGGFFNDKALLDRLVRDKLQSVADEVAAEGWGWVTVMPDYDHEATALMRRIRAEPAELTEDEQDRLDRLQEEHDAFMETYDGEPVTEEEAEQFETLKDEIVALTERKVYAPDDKARAGAIVTLGWNGEVRIERGFLRPNEAGADADEQAEPLRGLPSTGSGLSEKLAAELTAHRTAALRNELAASPQLARRSLLHVLVARLFFPDAAEVSSLRIKAHATELARHAPDYPQSRAGVALEERHAAWLARMPEEADGLWDWLAELDDADADALMAHCVSLTLDAVDLPRQRECPSLRHADQLATGLGLDMTRYWQPTPENYLGRVSKKLILEAVTEGVGATTADALANLKKSTMAEAAAQRLSGKGWLPALLRGPSASTAAEDEAAMVEAEAA